MNTLSRLSIAAVLAAFAAGPAAAEPIKLGQVSLSFYAVTGGIVQHVLEKEGYTVEVIEGSHADIYPKVGTGDVDILAASWLPSAHAGLYKKVENTTFKLAKLYDDARLYWTVPFYVPAAQVSSVADLAKPEVRTRMANTIVSLPESTGLTTVGREVLKAYGLDAAGYRLKAAPPAEWIGTFRQAYEAGEWIVFPLWQPQWINAVYDVRVLDEPKGIYGKDSAFLVAHQGLKSKLSDRALKHLGNIRLSVPAITEMDRLMNVERLSPREAAERWIADNPDIVAGWKP
jgi:glycine betaine/proline transport system substrate-binding protein